MTKHKNLFEEFNPISKEEWLKKVEKDLKGKSLESLTWQLEESLRIDPFYHPDDHIASTTVFRDQSNNDWAIGEDFLIDDPIVANKKILVALANGVNAPRFIFQQAPSVEILEKIFKEIVPSYIQTHFKIVDGTTEDYTSLLNHYHQYLTAQAIDSTTLEGSLSLATGQHDDRIAVLNSSRHLFPLFKTICLNFQDHQPLPSEVIKGLTDLLQQSDQLFQNIEAEDLPYIYVSISIGNSYFVEIARIRAIRILWHNLLQAYQVKNSPLFIDAHTAPDAYDEDTNTNMIRSMTTAMSAVVGGIDRLSVLPANAQEASTQRIARNVQHLLKMESYLDRVIDPAVGSFYLEQLTRLFVEQAWERFRNE